jgi:hypothetical protein
MEILKSPENHFLIAYLYVLKIFRTLLLTVKPLMD